MLIGCVAGGVPPPFLSFVSHALFIDSPSLRGDLSFSCFQLQAALSGGHLVRSGKLGVGEEGLRGLSKVEGEGGP